MSGNYALKSEIIHYFDMVYVLCLQCTIGVVTVKRKGCCHFAPSPKLTDCLNQQNFQYFFGPLRSSIPLRNQVFIFFPLHDIFWLHHCHAAPQSKNPVSANIKHSRHFIKRQISGQSTSMAKGRFYKCLIWQILPLV